MAFLLSCASTLTAAITSLADSSLTWNVIPGNYDFVNDQQTGQGADDIVGDANNPGFFTGFFPGAGGPTDGDLAFRVRLAEVGNKQSRKFGGLVFIGIDADQDNAIDLYLSASDKNNEGISIRDPGTGLNISPNTTTVGNAWYEVDDDATNFNYRAVDTELDGGTTDDVGLNGLTDYYLSFSIEFAQIALFLEQERGITGVTTDTPLRYVLGTATQSNSFNQDIGGIDGNDPTVDLNATWDELGAITVDSTASGGPVPEPNIAILLLGSLGFGLLIRRRKA